MSPEPHNYVNINPMAGLAPFVLKVSGASNPASVAGALTGVLRDRGEAELQAIGAGAINQMVKAIAISRGHLAPQGQTLACVPAFTDITIQDDGERTGIRFEVWIERRR